MDVLFIHSEQDPFSVEKPLETEERVQFGISYISALLKTEGHETRLLVLSRDTRDLVDEYIREFDPGLICFTSVYTEFSFLSDVATRVKKSYPHIFLLAGGPHASLKPDECLQTSFDAICVGEGEYPTLELVEQLEEGRLPKGIPNLYINNGGEIERNQPRPFIEDLDSLPFADREMWLPWIAIPNSRPSVLVGRGCPFQCTYCCNHALRRLADGKYVRLRSPQNIVDELYEMNKRSPSLIEVYLEVETLGVNPEWAMELCARLERMNSELESPIAFGTNLRITPNTDYEDLFAAFERSNFRFINIGLESGSERIRREVLKRNYSNQDIIGAVQAARRHGLEVGMYNLIGIPGETRKDFRETIRVNRVCQPDWFLMSVFFPYPGTELHDSCLESGLLDIPPDHELERRRPVFDLPGFSKRQVRRRHTLSHMLIYGGHRSTRELMWLVIMTKIFSDRRLLKRYRAFQKRAAARRSN